MTRWSTFAALGASLVIAAPLAWIGGELHKENCIHTAQVNATAPGPGGWGTAADSGSIVEQFRRFRGEDAQAIRGCSVLP